MLPALREHDGQQASWVAPVFGQAMAVRAESGSAYPDRVLHWQVYQELDEKLQQAFEDMLSERGVTPELGEYLMRLSEDKEQREYMGWLQRVADVIQ